MSGSMDAWRRLKIIAFVMTAVLPVFLALFGIEIWRQIGSRSWPSVRGQVRSVTTTQSRGRKGLTMHSGRVEYVYSVGNDAYTSARVAIGPQPKRLTTESALEDVARFQPGAEVRVYYDPTNPKYAILEPRIQIDRVLSFIGLAISMLICSAVSVRSLRTRLGLMSLRSRSSAM